MTLVSTSLTVWTSEHDVPDRFVWKGTRYRVTDTPTPLDFEIELLTHIAAIPNGWRLQGTDEDGESVVFDLVQFGADPEWHVMHTYR